MRSARAFLAALCLGVPAAAQAQDAAPRRVVSINLCTDQLAMMLAAPGQLHSVSMLATDPRSSAMVEEAQAYDINHALAEEVWLMQPDLVLAGQYSSLAAVAMLRRLGVRVAQIAPANSLEEVRDHIAEVGTLLHREAKAEALTAQFDADLAALRAPAGDARPRAALYYANGYTTGDQTLAGQILAAAGFANVAAEAGFPYGGPMPLELLAMAEPDALITSRAYPGGSRSEEILEHPVVERLRDAVPGAIMSDADWICGTPKVLGAMKKLTDMRERMRPAQ
ncbi:ABC transporter substrate-binding protein [Maritimibacter alkaliphilus]|uniref:ABC transporter substrate-binding protein n=1 Tax=Maritimibacter alkaliphilus TaxID=404236 RepID=UPI001C947A2C|nr:ABC transporter substrate-binding protein [Maritimibacter alkaliphilus]MBY6090999.1 ABC transporter substrate-binding protein [Maritimibacter alkaliphilus]